MTNCFCAHSSDFLYLFPSLLHNSGNKHQNNPLVSAESVRHSSTYIILYIFNCIRLPARWAYASLVILSKILRDIACYFNCYDYYLLAFYLWCCYCYHYCMYFVENKYLNLNHNKPLIYLFVYGSQLSIVVILSVSVFQSLLLSGICNYSTIALQMNNKIMITSKQRIPYEICIQYKT